MNDRVDELREKFKEVKAIKQIMPAENWFMETLSPIDDKAVLTRVACWAVCENKEGEIFVTGLFPSPLGALLECSGIENFHKYVYRESSSGYVYESPQLD